MEFGDALIVTDVQVDFCPGGALPVPGGDEIIPELNRWIADAVALNIPVFVTRDWHPENHISFKEFGGPWPRHCVQGWAGAEFHPQLNVPDHAEIVSKATSPDRESYSAFGDTDLAERLRRVGAKRLWIAGLALDYCVKETALDARRLGYEVHVLESLSKAIDASSLGHDAVARHLKKAGVILETKRVP